MDKITDKTFRSVKDNIKKILLLLSLRLSKCNKREIGYMYLLIKEVSLLEAYWTTSKIEKFLVTQTRVIALEKGGVRDCAAMTYKKPRFSSFRANLLSEWRNLLNNTRIAISELKVEN